MKISLLIASRKNSKLLSKLLMSVAQKTHNLADVEVSLSINAEDTWNSDLIKHFDKTVGFKVVDRENLGLGRAGLHEYFNRLANMSSKGWMMYLCDDHDIILDGWDTYLREYILNHKLKADDPYILVPRFDNTGTVSHVISEGFYRINGEVGAFGNIDSYLNDLLDIAQCPQIIHYLFAKPMLTDYTVDMDEIMSAQHTKAWINPGFVPMAYGSEAYHQLLEKKAERIVDELSR